MGHQPRQQRTPILMRALRTLVATATAAVLLLACHCTGDAVPAPSPQTAPTPPVGT
ncbi:putative lipoprotein [Streptomyces turgidiscabies Car8]|uniref:Putative lipoprotein n=1 Tax=Streptomyces turgidiscabies (strain Car8) TaxID=698760 RepID=L7FI62_STRT8|nr:putative lipoprotein [Streptomyces turgidiscabies Car8]